MDEMYDDEFPPPQRSGGGVLPWVLFTIVTVVAAVALFSFNSEKEQALSQMKRAKDEVEQVKSQRKADSDRIHDLQKQLDEANAQRQQAEADKAKLEKDKAELSQQVELAKTAPAASKGKRTAMALKSKRRRY